MRRYRLIAGGVLVLLVAAFALLRVFLPTDTLDRAHQPWPAPAAAYGHVYGELMKSPLYVGTRMRIYGADNRVWADAPVYFGVPASALWAYRRWPEQLVGVVADDRVVVSKWSDGQLVAIEADTGRVAWRADGGRGTEEYTGRRTGAVTVYQPPDLYLTTSATGSVVVSVSVDGRLTAFDATGGRMLWREQAGGTASCRGIFTAPRMVVVLTPCTSLSTVDFYDAATGKPPAGKPGDLGGTDLRPVGCPVGRSGCTGIAGPGGGWLIGSDGSFTAAPYLTGTGSWLVGQTVVHPAGDQIVAHDAVTGAAAWAWPAPGASGAGARIVAAEPGLVHLLTPDRQLVNVETDTGLERSRYPAHVLGEDKPFAPGYVYASHGYVAIERLLPGGRPEQKDGQYYYPFPTVLLTGS
jgi:outer membrane protein assembly factor BamB